MINVLCMKWGTLYGPEYVNRLAAAVRRHLPVPHCFVCFTEDPVGLDPEIQVRPLPQTGAPEVAGDTRWRKVALFGSGLGELQGTALFLDLDLVVVRDLTPFLQHPGEVCLIQDAQLFPRPFWKPQSPSRKAFYQRVGNSSVVRFEIGAHADILRRYVDDHASVIARYRNEQEYISDHLHGQGKLSFWPREWCASFKHDCVPRGWRSYVADPVLPDAARIVVFAGRLKMSAVVSGHGSRFYRRIGPAPWLLAAWAGRAP